MAEPEGVGVTIGSELAAAREALADATVALSKLEKTCCLPERSPRMAALAEVIDAASRRVDAFGTGAGSAQSVTDTLEEAGGQVGRLQIGCCAPNRLPLYSRILEDLTTVQLTLDRIRGLGH